MNWLSRLRAWRPTPNPIMVKELRSRLRGWRAFVTLTAVLSSMGLMMYLFYAVMIQQFSYSITPISVQIGQVLFAVLAGMLLVVISAITPAITAGSISSEMEKQTYEMLMTTPLHPAQILWGKLLSALMYVFLVLFAAIPMFSLVFTFGGVAIRDLVKALVVLLIVAVFIGVLGMFYSAVLKRSGRATVLAYLTLAALMFGPYFVYGLVGILTQNEPPRILLMPTPITALFSAMAPSLSSDGPVSVFWIVGLGFNSTFLGGPAIALDSIPRPVYHYSLPFFGFLSLLLFLITIRFVRPARRLRPSWRGFIIVTGILGGFLLLTGLAFGITANRYENIDLGFNRPLVEQRVVEVIQVEPQPNQPMEGSGPLPAGEIPYPDPDLTETPTPKPYPPP